MKFLSFLRRKNRKNVTRPYPGKQGVSDVSFADSVSVHDPVPLADWEKDLLEGRIGSAPYEPEPPVTLPAGFNSLIPVGSTWKRKPPKKEILRVTRVWYLSKSLSAGPEGDNRRKVDGYKAYGWTVRATPVRGGRPVIADAQWFLDNFDNQGNS